MSNTPEHDKIDALRYSNPLATNLAHMLLNGRGWVLENKLTDPPVRIPVARIAAALLGVDANAYRTEVDARFGIPTVPPQIADIVTDWAAESTVIDEIRALDEEVDARSKALVSDVVSESPIAGSLASGHPNLIIEGTVPADPDPVVDAPLRGTLLGAAVSLGLIGNEEAYTHPAFGQPLDLPTAFGEPEFPAVDIAPAGLEAVATPFTEPAFDEPVDVPGAPIPQEAFDALARKDSIVARMQELTVTPAEQTGDSADEPWDAPALDAFAVPAFESGDDALLVADTGAPNLATPAWDVPAFGPTGFDDLGVTPPDADFQFGSYDLGQTGAGDDFNGPILDPLTYDASAPVDGVVEATDDATLQARTDEALSYLAEDQNSDDLGPAFPDVTPAETQTTEVADEEQPPTFSVPLALPEVTLAPPSFDEVLDAPAPPFETEPSSDTVVEKPEHQHFDLINVPEDRFTPLSEKNTNR